jgi:phosphoglycolate phosphatase-like HAD superfamily hydrolase
MTSFRFSCVLLDFDGTFTLAEEEGAPFVIVYKQAFERLLDRTIGAEWDEAEALVRAHPAEHGWLFDDKVVAPGNADPYIRCTTVARMVMDRIGAFPDPKQRDEIVNSLYRQGYPHSAIVFRDGAKDVLRDLLSRDLAVYVVTNSHTEAVVKKIDKLLGDEKKPVVRGNSKKAVIAEPNPSDAAFERVPEAQQLPGLVRPIYVRRGQYYQVLRQIWQESGTTPERTLMVGDIYELDLALPHHLGVSIHLVTGDPTPQYEIDFVRSTPTGGVSATLEPVLARL